MLGNHQLFVRRNDPGRAAGALGRDAAFAGHLIGGLVYSEPEPRILAQDPASDLGAILADAGGEDHGVDSAHGGGQRPQLAADAIDEVIHRLLRVRVLIAEQKPHVAADAGKAQ